MSFHSGAVQQISMAARSGVLATLSMEDESVRIWSLEGGIGPEIVQGNYSIHAAIMPNGIAMHPSGKFIAYGWYTLSHIDPLS